MLRIIDANIVLRYLVQDDINLAKKAQTIIKDHPTLYPEVLLEVIQVLERYYKTKRRDIEFAIKDLFDEIDIEEKEVYKLALELYSKKRLDFVDCVLIARHIIDGDIVYTFDKNLNIELK